MNVKTIGAASVNLFRLAHTAQSVGPSFAKPICKAAMRQIWKLALQTLALVDSVLMESKSVKPGQNKMKKYVLCGRSRDFGANAATSRFESHLTDFPTGLAPALTRFRSGLIRPNPT